MRARMPRVRMRSQIEPGPAVEASLLDARDIVRNQIVSQAVPFVDRGPQLPGDRMDRDADRVANPRCVNAKVLPLRIVLEDVGATLLGGVRVLGDIRARSDRDEHPPSVLGKGDVPGPMTAAAQ